MSAPGAELCLELSAWLSSKRVNRLFKLFLSFSMLGKHILKISSRAVFAAWKVGSRFVDFDILS